MLYTIKYYRTARGDCPFETFVDGSIAKVRAKFTKFLDQLAQNGPLLRRPYADFLRDGIWELRVGFGGDQYRAFYFFWSAEEIIVTHGIIKKTAKVPPGEIERALRHRADYNQRKRSGEICD